MHHNSAHLPFLHIPHSPCSDLRKKKIKKKPKQNKTCKQAKRKRKYKTKEQTKQTKSHLCFSTFPACPTLIHPGSIENCSVSHSVFFCPVTFPYKCSLQWVIISQIQGLRFLVQSSSLYPQWNSSGISYGHPKSWRFSEYHATGPVLSQASAGTR